MTGHITRRACAALVLLALPLLAGCFQPVHAPQLGPAPLVPLRAIAVQPLQGFLGHELKTQLDFLLTGGDPLPERYRLKLSATESITGAVVDVQTGRAQVATLVANVAYVLEDISTGAVVTSGTVQGTASYDRTQQRFASLRANRDAQTRIARMVAELLRARLLAALASRAPA